MKFDSHLILVLILLLVFPSGILAQSNILNEDSLWRQKEQQLKGYTNINLLVATKGYKRRTLAIPDDHVYFHEGLEGPLGATTLPSKNPTSWRKYNKGSENRLMIYLTDTTSNWLGIVGGLVSQGIPFKISRDIDEALTHKVVMIYPSLSSVQFGMNELKKIRQHPKNGGALIGFNVTAPSMMPVFGYEQTSYSQVRNSIVFRMINIPETSFIREKNEITLRIGDPDNELQGISSIGYEKINYKPVAQFEDGSAAIIRNLFNEGAAYAFGFDLGHLYAVSHTKLLQAQRTYINDFEPSLDVMFRFIKSIYQIYEPLAVNLGTVPFGKHVPVLITHDVDYYESFEKMLLYADMERKKGVKATYFIQTKYIKDGLDIAYFSERYMPHMRALLNMGMEIGSHSVSHTPFFQHIPLGTGAEKYPEYRPYYYQFNSTFNETLLGELRVSRFLLNAVLGINATSFRSGYLTTHEKLHIGLQETGFLYSSNITANEVLSHMPFKPMYDYMFDEELNVYEIPVTIEDELPPEMDKRLDHAISLTNKIANYGGVVNILIHPDTLAHKFKFEEAYIDHFKEEAWFGTVSEFGDWWAARSVVEVDIENMGNLVKVSLTVPHEIEGLELNIPFGLDFVSSPNITDIRKTKNGILLGKVSSSAELLFTKR